MPTEQTFIIDPDNAAGTDYTSLNAYESTEQADLVTADENHVVQCRSTSGTKDTTRVNVTGWTFDATRNLRITAIAAHTGGYNESRVWSTSHYILSDTYTGGSNIRTFATDEGYGVLEKIQVELISSRGGAGSWAMLRSNTGSGNDWSFDNLICKASISGASGSWGIRVTAAGDSLFTNCQFIDFKRSTGVVEAMRPNGGNKFYNNTAINCTSGIECTASGFTVKNNICQDCTRSFVTNGNTGTEDYNLSDDTDFSGSNSVSSSTLTFVDKANDDYHLAAGDTDAIGAGIGPSSDSKVPTEDMDGDTRSGTTTDIGADLSATGTDYTLSVESGTFSITGQAVTFVYTQGEAEVTGGWPDLNPPWIRKRKEEDKPQKLDRRKYRDLEMIHRMETENEKIKRDILQKRLSLQLKEEMEAQVKASASRIIYKSINMLIKRTAARASAVEAEQKEIEYKKGNARKKKYRKMYLIN